MVIILHLKVVEVFSSFMTFNVCGFVCLGFLCIEINTLFTAIDAHVERGNSIKVSCMCISVFKKIVETEGLIWVHKY